jgi:hypothetical protein
MDTSEINYHLKLLSQFDCFIGAFARDQLPEIHSTPCGLILNTDPINKPGEHWVAIYINKSGFGEYFDSYGFPPLHKDIIIFLNKFCPKGWCHNTFMLQSINSLTCGLYCIFYIKTRCLGYSYCHFIRLFTNKTFINDKIVIEFFKEINNG